MSLDPGLGEAYWSLANLKTYRFSDEDFALMEAQADDKTMRREDFFHLCFALGKGYEDREQYEKAFHFYRLGNQVKDRQEGYSPATNRDEIERTIAVSTPELFLRHGGDGQQRGRLGAEPVGAGKGGVGKSTVSVHLALALARP